MSAYNACELRRRAVWLTPDPAHTARRIFASLRAELGVLPRRATYSTSRIGTGWRPILAVRPRSSAGKSGCLLSSGSQVRVLPGASSGGRFGSGMSAIAAADRHVPKWCCGSVVEALGVTTAGRQLFRDLDGVPPRPASPQPAGWTGRRSIWRELPARSHSLTMGGWQRCPGWPVIRVPRRRFARGRGGLPLVAPCSVASVHGPSILEASMSIPQPRGRSKQLWQYHSRSDLHSKVACWGVFFDLLRTSALLQGHASSGKVIFGVSLRCVTMRRAGRRMSISLLHGLSFQDLGVMGGPPGG